MGNFKSINMCLVLGKKIEYVWRDPIAALEMSR